jgi:2-dehydropantoate 2-reductase
VTVAVLGPGAVGGFVAGALARAGTPVTLVAREDTAARIARDGLRVQSVRLGAFTVHPAAVAALEAPADVLVVAVKAPALDAALDRIRVPAPAPLVVPLLNGVEHLDRLRERLGEAVVAGSIRIGAERPEPGQVVHSSPLFRVELAPDRADTRAFGHRLRGAEVPTGVRASEADVLWGKLARLCPLALATAAAAEPIGVVRSHPRRRAQLAAAVDEVVAVGRAEGAELDAGSVLDELFELAPGHTSSLARDVAARYETELDAIGGAVVRACARHGIACPAVQELVREVEQRLR